MNLQFAAFVKKKKLGFPLGEKKTQQRILATFVSVFRNIGLTFFLILFYSTCFECSIRKKHGYSYWDAVLFSWKSRQWEKVSKTLHRRSRWVETVKVFQHHVPIMANFVFLIMKISLSHWKFFLIATQVSIEQSSSCPNRKSLDPKTGNLEFCLQGNFWFDLGIF